MCSIMLDHALKPKTTDIGLTSLISKDKTILATLLQAEIYLNVYKWKLYVK